MKTTLSSVGAAAVFLAMTSFGAFAQIPDAQIAALKVGATDISEVISKFGRPMKMEKSSDGSESLTYTTTKTHVKLATFVPMVGLFAGGAKAEATVQRFDFGPDGFLVKVWTSETKLDCGMISNCHGQ